MSTEKLIIIGSGPAAWTAAIYASRADLAPLLLEGALSEDNRINQTLPLGQLNWATWVEDFPGFVDRVPGPELIIGMKQQAEHFGTRVITESITGVDLSSWPLVMRDSAGQEYSAYALIVASGGRRRLFHSEFVNNGVSVSVPDDCMLPRARKRPVAIIGGGDSAVTGALMASQFASKVFIIHRSSTLRAKPYYVDQARANPKIQFVPQRTIGHIIGSNTYGVSGIMLRNAKGVEHDYIAVSMIFLCLGSEPNTGFLENQLALDSEGYIRLDHPPTTQSSVPGVFAAGVVTDPIYRQAITAAGMGCKAALDAERWLAEKGMA